MGCGMSKESGRGGGALEGKRSGFKSSKPKKRACSGCCLKKDPDILGVHFHLFKKKQQNLEAKALEVPEIKERRRNPCWQKEGGIRGRRGDFYGAYFVVDGMHRGRGTRAFLN